MSTLSVSNITDGTEVYVPINGYYGFISNHGNVKDRKGNVRNLHASNSGYYRITLSQSGKRINESVHRLVADHFCCGKQDGYQVNHIDGNKLNNNADNLEWLSPSENTKHAFNVLGRKPSFKAAVVSDFEIPAILKRRELGHTYEEIAKDYNVSGSAIRNRLKRKSWEKWGYRNVNA